MTHFLMILLFIGLPLLLLTLIVLLTPQSKETILGRKSKGGW